MEQNNYGQDGVSEQDKQSRAGAGEQPIKDLMEGLRPTERENRWRSDVLAWERQSAKSHYVFRGPTPDEIS